MVLHLRTKPSTLPATVGWPKMTAARLAVTYNLDFVVVYADFRSDSLDVGFTGLDIGGFDLLPDQTDEGGDPIRCQGAPRT